MTRSSVAPGAVRSALLSLPAALALVASGSGAAAPTPAGDSSVALVDGPATISPVAIEQPARAFGRVIGDVLVQSVVVDEGIDVAAALEALPAGRIDAWFERLAVRVVERPGDRQALELRYQIVNAPTEPVVVRLPPVSFTLDAGVRVDVPEWPIAIGPLTARESVEEAGLPSLRPDRRLPPTDTVERRERLRATALAFGSSALAWLGWWLWRRRSERVRLPFARALHAMRALPAADRDDAPGAWTALHRALDDTAGGTVHRGSLDRLLEAAPWLAPSREEIGRFYEASAARFFSQPSRAEPFPVTELGRTLYRAERRNAR